MKGFVGGILLALAVATEVSANDLRSLFNPGRSQRQSEVIGITIVKQCPTKEVVAEVIAEGERLGAAYTEILPVQNSSACPANFFGTISPYVRKDERGIVETIEVMMGVTIGVHKYVSEGR